MKRFYTVKEAAEILGFSTNTIYKYLDEGKLKGKRIGRGRFKIPYEQLEPFLTVPEKVEHVIEEKAQGTKISEALKEAEDSFEGIAPERKDFIFFRFFLGLTIFGTGFINLIWPDPTSLLNGISKYLFSFSLIVAGVMTLWTSIIWKKFQKLAETTQLVTILILVYATFVTFLSKNYPLSIFLGSFAIILISQSARGLIVCFETGSFKKEFTFYTLAAISIGFINYVVPSFFTVTFISQFALTNKTLFAVLWSLFVVLPAIYMVVKDDRKLFYIAFSLFAILAFIVGAGASARGIWDLSYAAFLYGIFAAFLLWWTAKGTPVIEERFYVITLAFFWIALALGLGLLSVSSLQNKFKAATAEKMQTRLSEISKDVNTLFVEADSLVDSDNKKQAYANVILSGDTERAILTGKAIFDKSINLRRVLLLNKDGLVLGAYPRNSVLQGANLSSREYFQVVIKSLRSYVSTIFEPLINTRIVVKAIPVFQGNTLVGMIAIAYNLEDLTDKYQSPGSEGDFYAYDEGGNYVINIDKSKIGQPVDAKIIEVKDKIVYINENTLRVYDTATTPRWITYLERDAVDLLEKASNINDIVSVILAVNAALSLGAAFTLARKWRA